MTGSLVVNPYLQLHPFTDKDSEFVLTAPKPGEGLIDFTVSKSEHQNIFEVFTDLAQASFDFLDPDKDLTAVERDLLLKNGVLVKGEAKPEQPLFACNLEDVEEYTGEIDPQQLIVDPTFRFEPLNLANFASLSQRWHLSPFRSIAWITEPATGIERGYWLSSDDADLVSKMEAGESMQISIPETLLRRLVSTWIVGPPETFEKSAADWKKAIKEANTKFLTDKYAVVPSLLPPEQMTSMRRYYRQYVAHGFMPFGDVQVSGRYRQHNEPFASFLHSQLTGLMSRIVGQNVKLSYVYAASYKEGADLEPHTDREQCEFSISFQVDYEPEPPNQLSPWAIYIEPIPEAAVIGESGLSFSEEELERERKAPQKALYLASGDGLIYKGRELVHYRHALPTGHRSTSLFFHFVAEDFEGSLS